MLRVNEKDRLCRDIIFEIWNNIIKYQFMEIFLVIKQG